MGTSASRPDGLTICSIGCSTIEIQEPRGLLASPLEVLQQILTGLDSILDTMNLIHALKSNQAYGAKWTMEMYGKIWCDVLSNPMYTSLASVHSVMRHGINVSRIRFGKGIHGWTTLFMAVEAGLPDTVRWLCEHHMDVNDISNFQETPLLWAAEKGDAASMQCLLRYGATADTTGLSGRSALTWASLNGHVACVRMLVEEGNAALDMIDGMGYTPLRHAEEEGHAVVATYLRSRGAVDVRTGDQKLLK
jgi:hypothetical protein